MPEQKRGPGRPRKEQVTEDTMTEDTIIDEPGEAKPDKLAAARERRKAWREEMDATGALEGQKMVATQRKGFVRRWVNANGGRIDNLLKKGYSFVEDGDPDSKYIASTDEGSRKSLVVGRDSDANPQRAYLMEIPQEFYDEDQQRKQAAIDRMEADTRRVTDGIGSDRSRAYIPDGGSQFELD